MSAPKPRAKILRGVAKKAFPGVLRQVMAYYVGDLPNYENFMDDLALTCTDAQWQQVEQVIDEADDLMVDLGAASLYVTEAVLARREQRISRLSLFELVMMDERAAQRTRQVVAEDFARRQIVYRAAVE